MLVPVILVSLFGVAVNGHSYKLGGCPTVEPLPEFQMNKFLGKWYVIQKTSTGSRCITYNFTAATEPNEYDLEQVSEHPILGLASEDNKYHYTGHLTVPSMDTPAKMVVKFPMNIAGSASYIVFATDYDNYGAIFTCQKLAFANRQSATILSRKKNLDKTYLDMIRNKLSAFGVEPDELSVINQTRCQEDDPSNVNNTSNNYQTLGPKNIAGEKPIWKDGFEPYDGVDVVSSEKREKLSDKDNIIKEQGMGAADWLP